MSLEQKPTGDLSDTLQSTLSGMLTENEACGRKTRGKGIKTWKRDEAPNTPIRRYLQSNLPGDLLVWQRLSPCLVKGEEVLVAPRWWNGCLQKSCGRSLRWSGMPLQQ
jgi:hypothetical protein